MGQCSIAPADRDLRQWHAMRDDNPRPGAILGKALEPLNLGTDAIRVLVTLH